MYDIAAEEAVDFNAPQRFDPRFLRLGLQLQRAVDLIMVADRDQVQMLFPRQAQDRFHGFRGVQTG